jgi:hypothetical protein
VPTPRLSSRRALCSRNPDKADSEDRCGRPATASAVLVPERLEIGATCGTVQASQRNFDMNNLFIKMALRF